MGYTNGRYGFTACETSTLQSRFKKYAGQGLKNFDEFLRWCSTAGYVKHGHLRKLDERLPHGPENSYWVAPGTLEFPPGHPCRECSAELAAQCSRPCQARLDYWDNHMAAIRRRFGL